MALVHELSWSASRRRTFEDCRRLYYYNYYLSWLGWRSDAEPERREAYRLKKLTRLPMWAGESLHRSLAHWFDARAAGVTLERGAVLEHALSGFRAGYKESRDGGGARSLAKAVRLAEHHFQEDRIDEPSGNAREYGSRFVKRIEDSVANFFEAPELEGVRGVSPEAYLGCEEMGTIELCGTKVFAIPDFAFRANDGQVHIYDWKTGSPRPEDAFQLGLYALYAREKWDVAPEDVVSVDAYLPQGEFVSVELAPGEAEGILAQVEATHMEMRKVHFDADRSMGDPGNFPMIPEGSPEARACGTCNFRGLCERG